MNNFGIPFPPINNNYFYNYIEEMNQIKEKIRILEAKIEKLEKQKEQNYLKKEDSYYMI